VADFGLTLPEHDLTATEFKELARRLGRAAFVPLFLRFYERIVTSEATIEEQRKALADIGRWTGVEEDRKLDPNANLPVFNFVFGSSGGMTATYVPPPATGLPDPLPPVFDPELLSDPQTVQLVHRLMEAPDGNEHDPAQVEPPPHPGEPPAGAEGALGDGPRSAGRLRDHAGERPEAVQPAQAQAAAPPDLPHGAPVLGQAPEMTMDEHLADLDRLLGL
jgi:hypothetical protein